MGKETTTCNQCGIEFTYNDVRHTGKYCSRACMSDSFRVGGESTCDECGEVIYVTQRQKDRGRGKYCSMSCKNRGTNNPNWRGGREVEYGPHWNIARKMAMERDEYMCLQCGMSNDEHLEKHDQSLHIHHVIPYREFDVDGRAHLLPNLQTLCRSCHLIEEYH